MYPERAAQCLALAERAQRDDDKATWLELAGKWQRLAEEAASRGRTHRARRPELQVQLGRLWCPGAGRRTVQRS
jgi:hypothetical protein